MRKIRILLADDHKLMRSGLRLLVEQQPDLTVVGEANDGREAVSLAKSLKPDVIVMDIGMPNLNGIEAALQITQANPQISVVMLSMHSDESYVLRALKAGAKGYLLKDSAESDLIKAVHAVADGKSFFSPAVSKVLLDDYVRKLKRSGAEDAYDLLTAARTRNPPARRRRQIQQRCRQPPESQRLHRRNSSLQHHGKTQFARASRN